MSEMTKLEEIRIGNLQDCWSILYEELADGITQTAGIEGEKALREGIRRYGVERGEKMRRRHQQLGMKLNLETLFTNFDLPGDPRFKREKISLNPQQRLSYTLTCPIADQWIRDGKKALGRIYCEEFHHACFGTYAPKSQTNLAKTLTEDGDNYCCFSVYLRPGNMTEEERKEAFAEFDPQYNPEEMSAYDLGTHKDGYNRLSVLIIRFIAGEALKALGDKGEEAVILALHGAADHIACFMKERAEALDSVCDEEFLAENMPLSLAFEDDTLWKDAESETLRALVEEHYYDYLKQRVSR